MRNYRVLAVLALALALSACGGGKSANTANNTARPRLGEDSASEVKFSLSGSLLRITRTSHKSAGAVGQSFTVVCVTDLQKFAKDINRLPTSNRDIVAASGQWSSVGMISTIHLPRVLPAPVDACFTDDGVIGYFDAKALGIVQAQENSQPASTSAQAQQAEQLLASAKLGALHSAQSGRFPAASALANDILSARSDLLGVRSVPSIEDTIAVNIPYIIGDFKGGTTIELAVREADGKVYTQRVAA